MLKRQFFIFWFPSKHRYWATASYRPDSVETFHFERFLLHSHVSFNFFIISYKNDFVDLIFHFFMYEVLEMFPILRKFHQKLPIHWSIFFARFFHFFHSSTLIFCLHILLLAYILLINVFFLNVFLHSQINPKMFRVQKWVFFTLYYQILYKNCRFFKRLFFSKTI